MAKAKVKLNLQGLTDRELVQKTRTVVTQSTGNPAATGSPVTLVQLTTAADGLEAKLGEAEAHDRARLVLTSQVATLRTALFDGMTGYGGFVDIKAAGDETVIRSTGWDVRLPTTTAVGPLGQVLNLSVTVGDHDGELDLDWDNVRGAKGYLIQQSPDPVTPTSWTSLNPVSPSKATIKNLTSGTKYWFRIAANGTDGPGPWSNPVAKIAP